MSVLAAIRRGVRLVWQASPRHLTWSILLELVVAGALALTLFAGREVVDLLTTAENPTTGDILPSVVLLGTALVLSGVSQVAVRELRTLLSEQTVRRTQQEIVEVATSVDYEQFESARFHDLLERANSQAVQASYRIVSDLLNLLNVAGTSAAVVVVLAGTVPEVLVGLVLVGVPFAIATRISAQLGFKVTYDLTSDDRLRNYLYRAQTGKEAAKELRVFGLARWLGDRWNALYGVRIERLSGLSKRRLFYNGLAALASSALVAAVLVVLVNGAIEGRVSFADAAVAIVALQQLAVRIRTATNATGSLRGSALYLDDFDEFCSLRGDSPPATADRPLPHEVIAVEDVSFGYPGTNRTVLEDISIHIDPGEVVALVGNSGSGKTTLANLVAGLYRPSSGRITYGGKDIHELDYAEYRRSLAVVFQDFERYEMSARENVAISDYSAIDDLARTRAASRMAGIDEAIATLPSDYETMLSRNYVGGVELSVGQWQRIAIARAFFRDAPILVLDEPAAALDPMAENELMDHLRSLVDERSVLMISHRFSTVKLADRILVMADGRIVEQGNHHELMSLGGRYAELFSMQAKGYLPDPPRDEPT